MYRGYLIPGLVIAPCPSIIFSQGRDREMSVKKPDKRASDVNWTLLGMLSIVAVVALVALVRPDGVKVTNGGENGQRIELHKSDEKR